ncbi:MAG TPA: hypothetical protein DDW98_01650 [Gammaproteobacteria bacterium]|nr:hypothetical protein [Gammaproteobacteria bacterium]
MSRLPVRPRRELNRPRLSLPSGLGNGDIRVAALLAAAGFGKSTVMARWLEQLQHDGVPTCWLGMRGKHRDAKSMLQALVDALQDQVQGLDLEGTRYSLHFATSSSIDPVVANLLGELENWPKRLVLFLDDLEQLGNSAGTLLVQQLIDLRPAGLDLVLGSRDLRQFSLTRDRMAGRLLELKSEDLSFSAGEVESLMRDQHGVDLSDDVLRTLTARTEGWPAALGLFGLAVSRGSASRALSILDVDSREIAEYLHDVLLGTLTPDTLDLLLRASVPDHLNLDLLRLLAPERDPASALEQLLEATPFLQPLGDSPAVYRFHSLCADFLRRRLRLTNAALYSELLRKAGDWCWANGDLHEGVNCARAAADWELMAERVEGIAERLVRGTGEFDAYLDWMRDLPVDVLRAHPRLFVHQAWALCFKRDMAQSEIALSRLEALLPSMTKAEAEEFQRVVNLYRAMIEAIMDRGQSVLPQAQDWVRQYPNAPAEELGPAYCILASGARNANQHELSLSSIQRAAEIFSKLGGDYSLCWVHNIRLSVLIKCGRFTDARAVGQKGLEEIGETLGETSPAAGMTNAMLAYLAYERGDSSRASELLDRGLRFITNYGVVDPLYYAYLTQSWLTVDNGNPVLARDILREGEQLGIKLDLPRLTCQLATRRALSYLHAGDPLAADAVIQSRRLMQPAVDDLADTAARCAHVLQLNLDLLQGRYTDAVQRARGLSKAAAAVGGLRMKAEYDLLWAVALYGSGEVNEAGRRFRELLAHAAEQQRYRFVTHYKEIAKGLVSEHLMARQQAWASGISEDAADAVLKALVQMMELGSAVASHQDTAEMLEGLTRREVELLSRAARSGLSNRKLAEALFVSEGTLKWHLHNIYGKFGVRNRTGAVAQAQRLGLLSN